MPKHNFIMNLIRGLGGSGLKKVVQTAADIVAPGIGSLVLKGGELLSKFAPGLAEKAVDLGLKATPMLLKGTEKIAELVGDSLTEPNATVVPSIVADRAPALFPGNVPMLGRGDGMLLFGNDQPVPREIERPVIKVERERRSLHANQFMSELPKVEYVPPSRKSAFTRPGAYLGDAVEPPRDASEAGWYFRKVGKDTNIPNDAPGFGEIYPQNNTEAAAKKMRAKMLTDAPSAKGKAMKKLKREMPVSEKMKKVKKVKVPEVLAAPEKERKMRGKKREVKM